MVGLPGQLHSTCHAVEDREALSGDIGAVVHGLSLAKCWDRGESLCRCLLLREVEIVHVGPWLRLGLQIAPILEERLILLPCVGYYAGENESLALVLLVSRHGTERCLIS